MAASPRHLLGLLPIQGGPPRARRLTDELFEIKYTPLAEVAELADALRSGRSEGSLMWVQVPPSAPGMPDRPGTAGGRRTGVRSEDWPFALFVRAGVPSAFPAGPAQAGRDLPGRGPSRSWPVCGLGCAPRARGGYFLKQPAHRLSWHFIWNWSIRGGIIYLLWYCPSFNATRS
jgi:hypothetical protein